MWVVACGGGGSFGGHHACWNLGIALGECGSVPSSLGVALVGGGFGGGLIIGGGWGGGGGGGAGDGGGGGCVVFALVAGGAAGRAFGLGTG